MDHTSIDIYLVIDTFLLLLIGIGPKIALVPFLEVTATIDRATKALIARKMLTTAGVVAVILVGLGELLARLLHFSTGSLSIAGGIILVIIAVTMVLGSADPQESQAIKARDPMRIAVFPPGVGQREPCMRVCPGDSRDSEGNSRRALRERPACRRAMRLDDSGSRVPSVGKLWGSRCA